jgi:hypothetical protein
VSHIFAHVNNNLLHHYYIALTLHRMFETCIKTLKKREDAFDALISCHPKDRIAMWEAMDDKPKLVDGSVISVYEA